MNRRLEEKIIAFAYGELEPRAEAAIRDEISRSPEAASLYADYRRSAELFGALQEAPDPSLGTERLKQEILSRGLSQQPRWFGTMGTIAGAAVAAFLWIMVSNHPSRTTSETPAGEEFAVSATATETKRGSVPAVPIIKGPTTEGLTAATETLSHPKPAAKKAPARTEAWRSASTPLRIGHAVSSGASSSAVPTTDEGIVADAAVRSFGAAERVAPTPPAFNGDEVVLIESGAPEEDGTTRATEARFPDGVSIGG